MKRFALIPLLALAIGCDDISKPKTDPPANQPTEGQPKPQAQAQNNQGGVTPMAPGVGAGPMTPVAGTESVQGSGGGSVSMAAKDMAKKSVANQQNQQNQQVPTDETE